MLQFESGWDMYNPIGKDTPTIAMVGNKKYGLRARFTFGSKLY